MKTQNEQTEFDKFLLQISPSLKLRIQNYIFSEKFKKNIVIKKTIEFQEEENEMKN